MVHRLGPTPKPQGKRVSHSTSGRQDKMNTEYQMQYTVFIDNYQIRDAPEQALRESLRVVFTIHES
jgi:hypothetical protein